MKRLAPEHHWIACKFRREAALSWTFPIETEATEVMRLASAQESIQI